MPESGSPDGGQPGGAPQPGSPDGGLAGGGYGGRGGFPGPGGSPDGGAAGPGFGGPGPGFGGFPGGSPDGGGGLPGGIPDMSAFRLPVVKSLRDQAIDAFRANNETLGQQLLLTHFAVVPSAGAELAEKMAWIPVLRRPALGPRIGVVAFYDKPPRDFKDSPMPIGSSELAAVVAASQQQQQGGDEGGRRRNNQPRPNAGGEQGPALAGGPGIPGAGGDGAGTRSGELAFHTGEFGTKLVEAIAARISAGEYGAVYKEISEGMSRPATPDPNNPGDPNAAGAGAPGAPGAFGGDGGPGLGRGRVPGGLAGAAPGGEGAGGEGAAVAGSAQPLGLCIVWLGKVTSKEEAARLAQEAKVDILATYEIDVKLARNSNFVNNTTLLRITPTKKGEPIFASKALNNLQVVNQKQATENPVDKEITRAMEALDKVCKAAPLPALTAEQVKGQLARLVAEKPADPLPVIVEARYYVAKGLLPEADMTAAAIGLMGEAEFARLIVSAPEAKGQIVGAALSLPGVVNLLHGLNSAAGAAGATARRPNPQPGAAPGEAPPPRGGLRGLLPFGSGSGR